MVIFFCRSKFFGALDSRDPPEVGLLEAAIGECEREAVEGEARPSGGWGVFRGDVAGISYGKPIVLVGITYGKFISKYKSM